MFGIELKNNNQSSIVGAGEKSYLYWGKKTVTVQGSNRYSDATLIDLFNLPATDDVIVFAYSTGSNALIITDTSSGKWKAKAYLRSFSLGSESTVVTVLVFVQASYVDLPSFGVVIYEPPSKVKWHSGRPCIKLKDYRYHDNNSTVLNPVVVGYIPAVIVGNGYATSMIQTTSSGIPAESRSYDGYVWHVYGQLSGTTKQHGLTSTRVADQGIGYFEGEYYATNTLDIPLSYVTIDASYFEQFTSLGNK